MDMFQFLSEVGVPIFGAVVMAFFIYLTLKYILESVLGQIESTENVISMLETRTGRNIDVVCHILPSARRSDSSLAMADWVTSTSSPTVATACVRRGSA